MNKVTYLFGAGASKNALPITNEIPERLQNLIEFLSSKDFLLDDKSKFDVSSHLGEKSKRDYQNEMISSLNWLMTECKRHASIDTFAKKLFLKKQFPILKKLKIALSIFFVFEQARNNPDNRYDTFFASILNKIHLLPVNIKILSWNYDYQFELAFSEYTDKKSLSENKNRLYIVEKYRKNYDNNDSFKIFKLNGSAGLFDDDLESYEFIDPFGIPVNIDFVSAMIEKYIQATYSERVYSSLSFAWEPENPSNDFLKNVVSGIQETDTLVVIGYSFPFFNRDVDKNIINSMKNLKKVYFQAPIPESLLERFQALRDDLNDIDLELKKDVSQFLLPNEL